MSRTSYPKKISKTSSPSYHQREEIGSYSAIGDKEEVGDSVSNGVHYEYKHVVADRGRRRKAEAIVAYAESFLGTRYRYGGMSSGGMDCSGLVHMSFLNAVDIDLPRQSREIAKEGARISKNELEKGDLVFFKTQGSRRINHLGIVVENNENEILFIHASLSGGVMVSELSLPYWNKAYEESRRVL